MYPPPEIGTITMPTVDPIEIFVSREANPYVCYALLSWYSISVLMCQYNIGGTS
jgi:hypothetical protein